MATQSHRRQVLLFLAAILLPCAALVALGMRLVVQERELAASRHEDERRRVTRQLRQELFAHLERTALLQSTALSSRPGVLWAREYDDSIVALLARLSRGQLMLPWEHAEKPGESRALVNGGQFGERLRAGERAEFLDRDLASAVAQYRRARSVAEQPVQEAQGRLLLARALSKAGREEDAVEEYRELARVPAEVVDENGIPFCLYAARQLLSGNQAVSEVRVALRNALSAERWLAPPALYLLQDLVTTLLNTVSDDHHRESDQRLAEEASRELARTEQALALQADFGGLGVRIPAASTAYLDNTWIPFGEPAWFVGAVPAPETEDGLVVAVRSQPVLASLETGGGWSGNSVGKVTVTWTDARGGEPLGAGFPGLFLRFDTQASGLVNQVGTIRWWFYSAGLLLVLGVTVFGAYLLWRDVRREVQLAETRSRFVAAVSHELKTPLTAIRMFAETLHDGGTSDQETQAEYLETIVNESERLTRLLNNVLDFSKIESGRKTYRREPQSLEEIVRFTARAMQYPLEQKRFELRLDIEEGVPPVRVDRDAIEQAILNLLANAMKYSGESRDIDLSLRSEGGEAVIEVSDQGVGIDPVEVSRIFDRFYRVSGPENDHVPGTGLGLTLVQHIAEAHGGRVTVRSEPGKGSTFSLVIPYGGGEE